MHAHGGIAQQLLFACLTGMWTALQPGHLTGVHPVLCSPFN